MKALVVLSHFMTKDGTLEVESEARAKLAIDKFSSNKYDCLITIGWAYRDDSTKPIANVVKKYIAEHSAIDEGSIISLTKSRDTVGDAFFCLEFFADREITELNIITSDYHVKRTKIIFNSIFNSQVAVELFGVSTLAGSDISIMQYEEQSLKAFFKTFKGVDFSSKKSIFEAMSTRHPFYNGEVYDVISL